jgi:DNA mismatch repair protein MutS
MEIDHTTLADLSISGSNDEFSLFNKLNFCQTSGGRDVLYKNFNTPLSTIQAITGIQQTIQFISKHLVHWPSQITNGSVMMIERFYHASIDEIPSNPSMVGVLSYKIFSSEDFSFVKYSTEHAFDFIKGMQKLVAFFICDDTPKPLRILLNEVREAINNPAFDDISQNQSSKKLSAINQLKLGNFLRYQFRQQMFMLVEKYYQLDAWYSMAIAVNKFQLVFPEFTAQQKPLLELKGLFHILLPQPVDYDIQLLPEQNFLFLTGANMAGKSTFIKSVGAAVFLAHIGMGVPAKSMRLSLFDGLLSNINVMDNITKGESYFYNEVQRIKSTIQKISDGRNWLILIDELFKGTNVQDAMKCSTTVIEGLQKMHQTIFILSTHLYEIGEPLKRFSNIVFKYFETRVLQDQLVFNYQLKDGISNDRLGYLILKREGVVEMLQKKV